MASTHLKRTSLYDVHRAAGARMVEFGGWEMPVQYAGIVEEHHAVRTAAGLFDVSHMGEVEVFGPGALESVQRLITNDAARLIPGQGLYSPVCLPSGGIIDDLTVFRLTGDRFLFVVNASRTERDFQWIAEHTRAATARDRSADLTLLALQGPKAQSILERLTRADLTRLASFHFTEGQEVAGLGARDTLRLEAGYMLYGNDIDETATPLEAPLGWTVKFDKVAFIGREALLAQKARGVARKLVGFEMQGRAVPRHGYALQAEGRRIGQVTSGTFGPWIRKSIGMGYVERAYAPPGTPLQVEIRGRLEDARVVKLPFYRRS